MPLVLPSLHELPPAPDFTAVRSGNLLVMHFNQPIDNQTIRVALRSTTTDWDTVYTLSPTFNDVLYCNATGASARECGGCRRVRRGKFVLRRKKHHDIRKCQLGTEP